ncbi:MAG TPA: hypothetical protein PKW99_03525 [Thauera sp.]|nr:hypothetical protein [Thauera sp.]
MKNVRPTEVKAGALEQRQHHTTDLFPGTLPAAPVPILPRPGTAKDAALAAIVAGKITQADFRRSWRLAAYIDELVDDGWAVCSDWITLPGWRDPIKRYWVDLQDPATCAAVAAYKAQSGQAGFITPELALLAVVAGLVLVGGA